MTRVGFTGTKNGLTELQKGLLSFLLSRWDVDEFHHGDCIGADEQAAVIAIAVSGAAEFVHPPTNPRFRANRPDSSITIVYEPKPYLDRNHDIVDDTDILVACPASIIHDKCRHGTCATVRYAMDKGSPVEVICP